MFIKLYFFVLKKKKIIDFKECNNLNLNVLKKMKKIYFYLNFIIYPKDSTWSYFLSYLWELKILVIHHIVL